MSKTRASRRRPKHLLCVGSPPLRRTYPPVPYSSVALSAIFEPSIVPRLSRRLFYRFPRTLVDAHHFLELVLYCTSCEWFSANLVYHRTLRAYDTHAPANPPPVLLCASSGSWGMVSVFGSVWVFEPWWTRSKACACTCGRACVIFQELQRFVFVGRR